jgi:hypothetical protein
MRSTGRRMKSTDFRNTLPPFSEGAGNPVGSVNPAVLFILERIYRWRLKMQADFVVLEGRNS